MLLYLFLGLGAFVMSLVGTRLTILALRKKQILLDIPNARSNHKTPVPRGGGIAVIFTIAIFLLIADASFWLIIGMFLLAAISLVDDWIRLSPLTRIVVQFFAVMIAVGDVQVPLLTEHLPPGVATAITVLAWVWFINLFNFMDGIDGIASSELICVSAGMLLISVLTENFGNPLSQHALIALSAGFGFLWWNWRPAKIFLGDVGSIPLGFLLGYMLLMLAKDGHLAAALILPAVFIADATITLLRRLWKRKRVWAAHSEHFYQQAVRSGKTHDAVCTQVIGVNFLLIFLAVFSVLYQEISWVYFCVAYGMVAAVLFFVMAHTPKQPAKKKAG